MCLMFTNVFVKVGATEKLGLPSDWVESRGRWMAQKMSDEHVGFFSFYRTAEGKWWREPAAPASNFEVETGTGGEVLQRYEVALTHRYHGVCEIKHADLASLDLRHHKQIHCDTGRE